LKPKVERFQQHGTNYDNKVELYRIYILIFSDIVRRLFFILRPLDKLICLLKYNRVYPQNFYVITGFGRTGSTLLRFHLHNPTEMINVGEIYNSVYFVDSLSPFCLLKYVFFVVMFPKLYLNIHYEKHSKGNPDIAMGLKFLISRNMGKHSFFLDEILNDKCIKKIFMYRKNIVERFYSATLAYHTRQWVVQDNESVRELKVKVNFDELIEDLSFTEKKLNDFLGKNDKSFKYITYEDFMSDKVVTLKEVCSFLKLSFDGIRKAEKIKKSKKKPFTELITNYNEIVSLLKETKYQRFL
jgi:LPS sulfotransferase NodH